LGGYGAVGCGNHAVGLRLEKFNVAPDGPVGGHRANPCDAARNQIAEGIATREQIALDDLYSRVKDDREDWRTKLAKWTSVIASWEQK
jgi:hypothetical protein